LEILVVYTFGAEGVKRQQVPPKYRYSSRKTWLHMIENRTGSVQILGKHKPDVLAHHMCSAKPLKTLSDHENSAKR
jgi:hypothetical protein